MKKSMSLCGLNKKNKLNYFVLTTYEYKVTIYSR